MPTLKVILSKAIFYHSHLSLNFSNYSLCKTIFKVSCQLLSTTFGFSMLQDTWTCLNNCETIKICTSHPRDLQRHRTTPIIAFLKPGYPSTTTTSKYKGRNTSSTSSSNIILLIYYNKIIFVTDCYAPIVI